MTISGTIECWFLHIETLLAGHQIIKPELSVETLGGVLDIPAKLKGMLSRCHVNQNSVVDR